MQNAIASFGSWLLRFLCGQPTDLPAVENLTWTLLLVTSVPPEYPSVHSTVSGRAATVFSNALGNALLSTDSGAPPRVLYHLQVSLALTMKSRMRKSLVAFIFAPPAFM